MIPLELTGRHYLVYLEGELQHEAHGLSFGLNSHSGRKRYRGYGKITCLKEDKSILFPFVTQEVERTEGFNAATLLTPFEFEQFNSWSRTDVIRLIQQRPETIIDMLLAQILDSIENWQRSELKQKKLIHRILLPPPITFGRLSRELIQTMLSLERPKMISETRD